VAALLSCPAKKAQNGRVPDEYAQNNLTGVFELIITVTLNPALDRTVYVQSFRAGTINRAVDSRMDAGGKGINVSKALKELGTESIACGLIAGHTGRQIKELLTSVGLKYDFVEVQGETRVNIKIIDESSTHTELNEPGFEITRASFDQLCRAVENYATHENIIVISGSVPPNLSVADYGHLCAEVGNSHAGLIIDATGPYLLESLKYHPDFIKPNRDELRETLGVPVETREDVVNAARTLQGMGAKNVAVSMGGEGAIFVGSGETLLIRAPRVPVRGPVGAGDTLVAGIAHGMENRMDFESLTRFAVAAATASVTIEGTRMASRRTVLKIFDETISESL